MQKALILAAIAAAFLSGAAFSSDDPEPTLNVSADKVSWGDEKIEASGNARATYGVVVLTADRLEVDTVRNVAHATGNVRVERPDEVLEGEELTYNLKSGDAQLRNGEATLSRDLGEGRITAHLLSKELRIDQGVAYVVRCRFTTCARPHPHWEMRADRLKITPHKGIEARGARVRVGRLRTGRMPEMKFGFHERTESQPLFPGGGVSSRDGVYVGAHTAWRTGGERWAGIRGRLGTKAGFRGKAFVTHEMGPVRLGASYGVKLTARDEVSRNLIVDRAPEFDVESKWHIGQAKQAGGLEFRVLGQWGHYRSPRREESGLTGRTTSDRLLGEAEITYRRSRRRSGWETGAAFRRSYYSGADQFSVLEGHVGLYGRVSRRLRGSLQYVRRFPTGDTPFEFDDVDIEEELLSEVNWRVTDRWGVGAEVRYDIDRGEARRAILSLSRVAHCLEYTVSYDTVLKDIGFSVNLATTP